MTDLIDTVQLQEIDDAIIELFDITLPAYEGQTATTVHLFNGLDAGIDSIWFPPRAGVNATLNEYSAFPIQMEGLSTSATGAQARPTLTTANLPSLIGGQSSNETILIDILEDGGFTKNSDLIGTRVEYRRTLLSKAFSASGTGTAIEFPAQIFVIDRVSAENSISVAFELTSPIDLEGLQLPNRVVIGRYCPWKYQGRVSAVPDDGGCTWPLDGVFGTHSYIDANDNAITTANTERFYRIDDSLISTTSAWSSTTTTYTTGNLVHTINGSHKRIWEAIRPIPVNKNPDTNPFYWKRIDVCGKRLSSCKIRYQGNSNDTNLNTAVPLPFGGFPGARTYK